LTTASAPTLSTRLIFRVVPRDGGWSVEHAGRHSAWSKDKAKAVASATKLARAEASPGQAAQVRIAGETDYF
jgi:Uncharacterized protein conserved in bacteria (DUF2188)